MTLDLDELERLEREATPGPWSVDADGCCVMLSDERGSAIQVAIGGSDGTEADARYIVALREAAPQLIAIARAAQTRSFVAQLTAPPIHALNPNPLPTQPRREAMGSNAQQFRKRPVVIEAMRFTDEPGGLASEITNWINENTTADVSYYAPTSMTIAICTWEGVMHANLGDWVIRGVKGEFYPCKPDIFDATYEPAAEEKP